MKLSEIDPMKPYKTSVFNSWKFVYVKGFSGLGRSSRSEFWGFHAILTLFFSIFLLHLSFDIQNFESSFYLLIFIPFFVFWILAIDSFSVYFLFFMPVELISLR